jgi:hypothetical protein
MEGLVVINEDGGRAVELILERPSKKNFFAE